MQLALRLVPAAVAVCLLAVPVTGQAATTVGELATSTNEACDGANNNLVQAQSAPGRNSYALPSDGVITSWAHNSRGISGSQLKLKVFRRVQGSTFTAVGESGFRPFDQVGDSAGNPARIPARAGDVLGLGLAANAADSPASCFDPGGASGDQEFARAADIPPGQSGDFSAGPFPVRLNVTALLEADADRDGFGDETQDGCPTNPFSQSSCPGTKPPDTRRPTLTATGVRRQRLSTRSRVLVSLRFNEPGRLTGGGSIALGNGRRVRFERVNRRVAGTRAVVGLRLSKKNLRRVRRVLRRGRALRAKVRLTLTDASGNATTVRRTVRLR